MADPIRVNLTYKNESPWSRLLGDVVLHRPNPDYISNKPLIVIRNVYSMLHGHSSNDGSFFEFLTKDSGKMEFRFTNFVSIMCDWYLVKDESKPYYPKCFVCTANARPLSKKFTSTSDASLLRTTKETQHGI